MNNGYRYGYFNVYSVGLYINNGDFLNNCFYNSFIYSVGMMVVNIIYNFYLNLTNNFLINDFWWRWCRFSSCLLYTSPSPRDVEESRMPSSA